MAKTASAVVAQAKAWIGCKESDGTHRKIIDVYNSHKPLARGYKLTYSDAWCAGFVSAVAIKVGCTDIIPTEVSCNKMIELCKKKGIWRENENYTPRMGDIIFYDWEDSGAGDNKGESDHVGIVEGVSGTTVTVIEGNYSNAVKRRTLKVNGRYIRGYALPKYDGAASSGTTSSTPSKLTVDGEWGNDTTRKTQKVLGTVVDGIVSGQLNSCKKYLLNCLPSSWDFGKTGDGSVMVKAVQKLVGATADGIAGEKTVKAMQKFLNAKGLSAGSVDGYMGAKTVKAWQKYINSRL